MREPLFDTKEAESTEKVAGMGGGVCHIGTIYRVEARERRGYVEEVTGRKEFSAVRGLACSLQQERHRGAMQAARTAG